MQISENTSLENLTVADLKLLVNDIVSQILKCLEIKLHNHRKIQWYQ